MRHLGDLNDLCIVQDVIFLSEIIENRIETMHKTYGFNPKKCKSASAMSGYIERKMSKIILALPTKLDHVEIFEQTGTGGFSSVNTRLAFDTQILLPNLIESENISVFQLLEQFVMGEKGPKSYRTSAKAHANLFKKCFLQMYLEDLAFCIKRAG